MPLHVGSESEQSFIELTDNKDVQFRLEWDVIRNLEYEIRQNSAQERDEEERDFFSKGLWA